MFGSTIRRFADNLESLRDFVAVLRPVLIQSHRDELVADPVSVAPMLLAFHQLGADEFKLNDDAAAKLRAKFDGEIEIVVKDEGQGQKFASITINGPGDKIFSQKMERLSKKSYQIELLHHNALMSLVSTTEWYLSQLLHKYFEIHPEASGVKGMSLTLEDLRAVGSVEEARDFLIESKIESVLRGSVQEWLEYLKGTLGLSMSYLNESKNTLIEICQRRNLVVHNGGVVNNIYLNKVPKEARPKVEIGEPIMVTKDYIDSAVAVIERNFILIGLELWKKLDDKSDERASLAMDIAFRQLKSQRWDVAEGISFFLTKDKCVSEVYQLVGKVNYWQAMKWSGQFEKVRKEIEESDMSAKDARFILAKAALLDDEHKFFELLPKVMEQKSISLDDLKEWPLFQDMRKCDRYLKLYGNAIEQNEAPKPPNASFADGESSAATG